MKEQSKFDNNEALFALSPADGRYKSKTQELRQYFSESALIKYRILIEIEYFIELHNSSVGKLDRLQPSQTEFLRGLYINFGEASALEVKNIERETNHDVKAVEYFLKNKIRQTEQTTLIEELEYIHFGLTSQDINNTSFPLMYKSSLEEVLIPAVEELMENLKQVVIKYEDVPMLAKTHGQPASPTRLGKELEVFRARCTEILRAIKDNRHSGKFGGATGNFNAHKLAHPEINWPEFANNFLKRMGLVRQSPTTQIEHYDDLASSLLHITRLNNVLIDLCRDIWTYISMNYFKQKIIANEVGSSAMPHKVNPIDFENAEGNLGIANAILTHLAHKLPISRLQRDLTDSTVLRNLGLPLGHCIIAIKSINKGLSKLELNLEAINQDLEDNWAVVAEALQTILRREAYPNPYEKLKDLTRKNSTINQVVIKKFIEELEVSEKVKEELRNVSPWTYTGY